MPSPESSLPQSRTTRADSCEATARVTELIVREMLMNQKYAIEIENVTVDTAIPTASDRCSTVSRAPGTCAVELPAA